MAKNKNIPIVDFHMHVVPGIDDGSRNLDESIAMLKLSVSQGVTDVFCTSHNGYSEEDGERYDNAYEELRIRCAEELPQLKLHKGCEVLCAAEYVDDIIYGLDIGVFSTLGSSKYVLTEFYPDTKPSEAVTIIKVMREHGYQPIIAHMERNYNLTDLMVGVLIKCGALVQVNAHSFIDEYDADIQARARLLLEKGYVHCIGSDAHRIDHRPPNIMTGVEYILQNATPEYAESILSGFASNILV